MLHDGAIQKTLVHPEQLTLFEYKKVQKQRRKLNITRQTRKLHEPGSLFFKLAHAFCFLCALSASTLSRLARSDLLSSRCLRSLGSSTLSPNLARASLPLSSRRLCSLRTQRVSSLLSLCSPRSFSSQLESLLLSSLTNVDCRPSWLLLVLVPVLRNKYKDRTHLSPCNNHCSLSFVLVLTSGQVQIEQQPLHYT